MSIRIALLCFLVLQPVFAFSRPSPPPELLGLFGQLESFEEALEQREWPEAMTLLGKTHETLAKLTPSLESERPQETEAAGRSLNKLKAAAADRDFNRAHASYLAFQEQLISIMDAFDYKIHPVLYLIDRFINEAGEGLRKDDLEEVVNELDEIEVLFAGKAKGLLEQRGAAPLVTDHFAEKVHAVRRAAAGGERDETGKGLAELRTLFSMLSGNFGSR